MPRSGCRGRRAHAATVAEKSMGAARSGGPPVTPLSSMTARQVLLGEVADTDRVDDAALAELDQCAPRLHVLADGRVGPVDQDQVEIVQPSAQ